MCGIAGIYGEDAVEHVEAVRRMVDAMAHRGPNGEGIYISPSKNCVLGHRRLAIIDLSEAAAQPMTSPDGGCCLVYNGECYNYRDLKRELLNKGESFTSSSDTEVVLKLLCRDGEEALPRLNAMFALASWDEKQQSLLLARDRYGQKPLYISRIGKLLLFASEVRALLASGLVPRRADLQAIEGYLSYGAVPQPQTIVCGVSILKPGSFMIVGPERKEKTGVYWSYPAQKKKASADELKQSFISAVERHLISDVPLGLFLSGGIDSSAIVSVVSSLSSEPIKTLSVVFPDQPDQSEVTYAARTAAQVGSEHYEIPVTGKEMLQMLPASLDSMDQPTGDAINTYLISHAARQIGLTVALSGLGGDELFAGYHTFADVPKMLRLQRFFSLLRSPLANLMEHCGPFSIRLSKLAEMFDAPEELIGAYLARRRVFSWRQVRKMIPTIATNTWNSGLDSKYVGELTAAIKDRDIQDAVGILEMYNYMSQTLLRDCDVMGMANSLEIRIPMLDGEFSSLALALESKTRTQRQYPKWRFVDSVGNILPHEISHRSKQGFTLPFGDWILSELKDEVIGGINVLLKVCKPMRKEIVSKLWDQFCAKPESVGWFRPWALFVLGRYLEKHNLEV